MRTPGQRRRSSRAATAGGRRRGFTLIEMFATVAVLIIVLGLMVSLARYVRRRSAEQLTAKLLVNVHLAMEQYIRQNQRVPAIAFDKPFPATAPAPGLPLPPGTPAATSPSDAAAPLVEDTLQHIAEENNRQIVRLLKTHRLADKTFRDLPLAMYDNVTVRDAWGTPILFVPEGRKGLGLSLLYGGPGEQAQREWFFLSAGADRQYLTREDNQVSYELYNEGAVRPGP